MVPCVGNCFLAYIVGLASFRALGGTLAIGKASSHTYLHVLYIAWRFGNGSL
jgi:hypothetical protein